VSGKIISYRHSAYDSLSLADNRIASIAQDSFGSLWLGSRNAGISRTNLTPFQSSINPVSNLLSGSFELETDQKIFYLKNQS